MLAKPVFAATWDGDRVSMHGERLYGTALHLGIDLLLTADHVVANVLAVAPEFAVGWGGPGHSFEASGYVPFARASVAARWPEVDLAALRLAAPLDGLPSWDMGSLPTLTQVASIGFPFGLDAEENSIMTRGFAGHIVGSRKDSHFTGNPLIFELSFATPRLLSGAPLLHRDRICGSVIGNYQTKMLVFSDEERVEEGGVVNRVERYEALNLGIAVSARTALSLQLPSGQTLLDFVLAAGAQVHNRT